MDSDYDSDSNSNSDPEEIQTDIQNERKEEKIGHIKKIEINTIANALKKSREKDWNERFDRGELANCYQKTA